MEPAPIMLSAMTQPFDVTDRNVWLLAVFCAFVTSILLFAAIYYRLYRRRREHFSFNADIQSEQSKQFVSSASEQLNNLTTMLMMVDEVELSLSVFAPVEEDIRYQLPSGCSVKVFTVSTAGPTGAVNRDTFVVFYGPDGREVGKKGSFGDSSPAEALVSLLDEKGAIQKEITYLHERLATVEEHAKVPDVWGFWDFIYFSTITQTTVGYGDILPNSTSVRKLVVLQILAGYALLVVALNVVFSTGQ